MAKEYQFWLIADSRTKITTLLEIVRRRTGKTFNNYSQYLQFVARMKEAA